MDVLRTVIIIEHLARLRKQGLDVFPYPLGAIGYHTQPPVVFRDEAGLLDLLERLAEVLFSLSLMPTQEMDDALTIEEREAQALGVPPLAAPQCPLDPLPSFTWPPLP